MVKSILIGVAISVTPPIIIDVTPLQLDLNGGYAAAAFVGWISGVLSNKELTWRGHAGGLLLSVILTLWVGAAITDITSKIGVKNIDYLLILFLAWAGVNFFKSILLIAKESTQEGIKKIIDGFFEWAAGKVSGKKKTNDDE